jgi:hypothetical protein
MQLTPSDRIVLAGRRIMMEHVDVGDDFEVWTVGAVGPTLTLVTNYGTVTWNDADLAGEFQRWIADQSAA